RHATKSRRVEERVNRLRLSAAQTLERARCLNARQEAVVEEILWRLPDVLRQERDRRALACGPQRLELRARLRAGLVPRPLASDHVSDVARLERELSHEPIVQLDEIAV